MPIKIKVDVTKLLKQHFFHGREKADGSKPIYADIMLWETPNDQYDNDYRVCQDLPKEARDAGEKGPILGNGKIMWNDKPKSQDRAPERKAAPAARKPPADPDLDAPEDDIPF